MGLTPTEFKAQENIDQTPDYTFNEGDTVQVIPESGRCKGTVLLQLRQPCGHPSAPVGTTQRAYRVRIENRPPVRTLAGSPVNGQFVLSQGEGLYFESQLAAW